MNALGACSKTRRSNERGARYCGRPTALAKALRIDCAVNPFFNKLLGLTDF
jgi:hypothetical protein